MGFLRVSFSLPLLRCCVYIYLFGPVLGPWVA